jgi:hypothetical protein
MRDRLREFSLFFGGYRPVVIIQSCTAPGQQPEREESFRLSETARIGWKDDPF